jgi:hypothetical protein
LIDFLLGLLIYCSLGMTKQDLDLTVGIHPTVAEEFTSLTISKSSGLSPAKNGC